MKGITFGDYHSFRDFRLILSPNNAIGTPTPKYELIDIPGGDGMLDFTEAFGGVKYGNRPLSFEFSTMVPQSEFMSLFATVQNALHGQKMKIVLDDDPEWYYIGRITVSDWKADRLIGSLTIDCDCEPFKYHFASQAVTVTGRNLLNLDKGMVVLTHEAAWTKTATGYDFSRGSITGGSFAYFAIPVKKGETYTFSATVDRTVEQTLYVYRDKIYGTPVITGAQCTFVSQENAIYIFGLYCSSTATSAKFANVMLQEGNTVGTYEAYDATVREVSAIFHNVRKQAVPVAYVSGNIEVESEDRGNAQVLVPGANTLDSFVFDQGDTTLHFKGNGYLVVEWLERGL